MPIPIEHMMERLQFAYVRAVVATAGATCQPYNEDYGSDARISAITALPNGKFSKSATGFECQLKASTTCVFDNGHVVYDLDAHAYNRLVSLEDMFGILILFRMPKRRDLWLTANEDILSLRYCCYWELLTGDTTTNTSTKRIKIPQHQLFDPAAVIYLLERVAKRQAEYRRWRKSQ